MTASSGLQTGVGVPEGILGNGKSIRGGSSRAEDAWAKMMGELPWGSVVKSPPATAGDTGLVSRQGRSHVLWGS